MRKVRKEYEVCAETYKNNMRKISERKNVETASTTTTIPTTIAPSTVHSGSRRSQISLMKRQQSDSSQSSYVSLETTTVNSVKNSSNNVNQGEEQIKTVCW